MVDMEEEEWAVGMAGVWHHVVASQFKRLVIYDRAVLKMTYTTF